MRANESCPDGALLCPAVFTSCPDGSCASTCGPYNGCPLDTPVMVCHLFHREEGEVEETREREGGVGEEVERRATEVNRKEYIYLVLSFSVQMERVRCLRICVPRCAIIPTSTTVPSCTHAGMASVVQHALW